MMPKSMLRRSHTSTETMSSRTRTSKSGRNIGCCSSFIECAKFSGPANLPGSPSRQDSTNIRTSIVQTTFWGRVLLFQLRSAVAPVVHMKTDHKQFAKSRWRVNCLWPRRVPTPACCAADFAFETMELAHCPSCWLSFFLLQGLSSGNSSGSTRNRSTAWTRGTFCSSYSYVSFSSDGGEAM